MSKRIDKGWRNHPFYNAWLNMKARCNNCEFPQSKDYMGRGIKYSPEWEYFSNFFNDMFSTWKRGLSLNRIDNNGNYCKENCNWVSRQEQARNMRNNTLNPEIVKQIKLLNQEAKLTKSGIAKKLNISYHCVYDVLVRGRWDGI